MHRGPIVLFDGVCNYCNRFVNFAIRHDPSAILRFAPLQGSTASRLREIYHVPAGTDSVILIANGKAYTYSDAALGILQFLRWPWKIGFGLKLIPRFLRQPVYKWIARNRYAWFGRREACMIPAPEVRSRFLD